MMSYSFDYRIKIGLSLALAAVLYTLLAFSFPFCRTAGADVYRRIDQDQVIHLTNIPQGPQYEVLIYEGGTGAKGNSRSEPYDEVISAAAGRYGLDHFLVKAVIKAESNFNPRAVSRKGARGLMQLMPQTALMLGVGNAFHPGENIDGGIRHLSHLISLYSGDLALALAAYNAGEKAVARYGGIPPYSETRTYVRQVLQHYKRYRTAAGATAAAAGI